MRLSGVAALATPLGFAVLCAALAGTGAVGADEAVWASLSALAATAPGLGAGRRGWRGLLIELSLLPAALALTLIADPIARRMVVAPLLTAAALVLAWPALSLGTSRPWVKAAALALAIRCAAGLALLGRPAWEVAAVLACTVVVAAVAALRHGPQVGLAAALLLGALPLDSGGLLPVAAAVVAGAVAAPRRVAARLVRGWLPGAAAGALLLAAIAPWGTPPAAVATAWTPGWIVAAAVATPLLPAAALGPAWLAATLALGPPRPAAPDRAGLELTAATPRATLPAGGGGPYLVELALANAAALPQGTVVGELRSGATALPLRAGVEATEWASLRDDVFPHVGHTLPAHTVLRPSGGGPVAVWSVSNQILGPVWWGSVPVIERAAGLPPEVVLAVTTAGPIGPAPPRSWDGRHWLTAGAVMVALLQLLAGSWRREGAWWAWLPLLLASAAARLPIEPLGRLAEEHVVDLVLLAVLIEWVPLASSWVRRRRVLPAALLLLVPLALATTELFPSGGDEPYHLIVLRSLSQDRDLDVANNYDLERFPGNRIYVTDHLLHSPALAALLLPGYAVAGRHGALAELAILGALLVTVLAALWRRLGLPDSRLGMMFFALTVSYPLVTFSSQIWVEIVGALAAAGAVALASGTVPRPGGVAAVAAAATVVKTRLGLVSFPVALAAAWPALRRGSPRRHVALVLLAALAGSVAAAAWFLGNPLGYGRRLSDLIPANPSQALVSLGGLVFDPAGGLAFAAPLALLALAGTPALWRRGGAYRALLAGGVLTVLALLHSREWYGGGAPPARYLVPLLPVAALAGSQLLRRGSALRTLLPLAAPATIVTAWTFATRPHLSFNPGDGGWWLADAMARRFSADARDLMPSFLRPGPATWAVPLLLLAAGAAALAMARRRPAWGRALGRATLAVTLLATAAVVLVLHARVDRVVEVEDAQVVKLGGSLEPPVGTFSRYGFANGWRLADGEGVEIPLHLGAAGALAVRGWLEGPARDGATLVLSWNGAPLATIGVRGTAHGEVSLPAPPPGRGVLRIAAGAPPGGIVVLDRVRVQP